jgi:glutamyl-tRNA reductase
MLFLLGMNHRSAPLSLRERAAFLDDDLPRALDSLLHAGPFEEALILSTCNRTEIAVRTSGEGEGPAALRRFLEEERGLTAEELELHAYGLQGLDVARHLFHVAAGLDSMILGEPQILGQVRRAYAASQRAGAAGTVLDPLLRHCLSAAKRVRTETGISRHAVSVAYAAVTLARRIFDDLGGRSVLLLGAGKMTELAARHLRASGVERIVVANRTYSRATALAERLGGEPVRWDCALDALERVDVVVTGTAAPQPVVTRARVQEAMQARRGRPLFFIDIAVPRDVDPEVNAIANVYLYDLDDLQGVVEANVDERRRAAEVARERLEAEVRAFGRWLQAQEITPTIVSLREAYLRAGDRELARFRRRLGTLSAEQAEAVDGLTRGLIAKLLHPPIRHLRQAAASGDAQGLAALYRAIFDLVPRAGDEDPHEEQGEPSAADPSRERERRRFRRGGPDG